VSAAEQTAKAAAAAAAGELCDEVLRVQAQFLQQARVLVGVDLLGQLLVGLLGLGLIALGTQQVKDLALVDLHGGSPSLDAQWSRWRRSRRQRCRQRHGGASVRQLR
jgi:hypothetical protein